MPARQRAKRQRHATGPNDTIHRGRIECVDSEGEDEPDADEYSIFTNIVQLQGPCVAPRRTQELRELLAQVERSEAQSRRLHQLLCRSWLFGKAFEGLTPRAQLDLAALLRLENLEPKERAFRTRRRRIEPKADSQRSEVLADSQRSEVRFEAEPEEASGVRFAETSVRFIDHVDGDSSNEGGKEEQEASADRQRADRTRPFDDGQQVEDVDVCCMVVEGTCSLWLNSPGMRKRVLDEIPEGAEFDDSLVDVEKSIPEHLREADDCSKMRLKVIADERGAQVIRITERMLARASSALEPEREEIREGARRALREGAAWYREDSQWTAIADYLTTRVCTFIGLDARSSGMEALCQQATLVEVDADSYVCRAHEICAGVSVLLRGFARRRTPVVSSRTASSSSLASCRRRTRGLYGEDALLDEYLHTHVDAFEDDVLGEWLLCVNSERPVRHALDVVAATPCEVLFVPKGAYDRYVRPARQLPALLAEALAVLAARGEAEAAGPPAADEEEHGGRRREDSAAESSADSSADDEEHLEHHEPWKETHGQIPDAVVDHRFSNEVSPYAPLAYLEARGFAGAQLLGLLPSPERASVCSRARLWRPRCGEVIYAEGHPADFEIVVLRGTVGLFSAADEDGSELDMDDETAEEKVEEASHRALLDRIDALTSDLDDWEFCSHTQRWKCSKVASDLGEIPKEATTLLGEAVAETAMRRMLRLPAPCRDTLLDPAVSIALGAEEEDDASRCFISSAPLDSEAHGQQTKGRLQQHRVFVGSVECEKDVFGDEQECVPGETLLDVRKLRRFLGAAKADASGARMLAAEDAPGRPLGVTARPYSAVALGADVELLVFLRDDIDQVLLAACQWMSQGASAAERLENSVPSERTPYEIYLLDLLLRGREGFKDLEAGARAALCHGASLLRLPRGALLCREGEPVTKFWQILQGSAEVSAREVGDTECGEQDDASNDGFEVGRVVLYAGEGFGFGERALLGQGDTHPATVQALEDMELIEIDRVAYEEAAADHRGGVSARRRALKTLRRVRARSPPERLTGRRLESVEYQVRTMDAFRDLKLLEKRELAHVAMLVHVREGEDVYSACAAAERGGLEAPLNLGSSSNAEPLCLLLSGCVGAYGSHYAGKQLEAFIRQTSEASSRVSPGARMIAKSAGDSAATSPRLRAAMLDMDDDDPEVAAAQEKEPTSPRHRLRAELERLKTEERSLCERIGVQPLMASVEDRLRVHRLRAEIQKAAAALEVAEASARAYATTMEPTTPTSTAMQGVGPSSPTLSSYADPRSPFQLLPPAVIVSGPGGAAAADGGAGALQEDLAPSTVGAAGLSAVPSACTILGSAVGSVAPAGEDDHEGVTWGLLEVTQLCDHALVEGQSFGGGWSSCSDALEQQEQQQLQLQQQEAARKKSYVAHAPTELLVITRPSYDAVMRAAARRTAEQRAEFLRSVFPPEVSTSAIQELVPHCRSELRPRGAALVREGRMAACVSIIVVGSCRCTISTGGKVRSSSPAGAVAVAGPTMGQGPAAGGVVESSRTDSGQRGSVANVNFQPQAATGTSLVASRGGERVCSGLQPSSSRGPSGGACHDLGILGAGHFLGLTSVCLHQPEEMSVLAISPQVELLSLQVTASSRLEKLLERCFEPLIDRLRAQSDWHRRRYERVAAIPGQVMERMEKMHAEVQHALIPRITDSPFLRRKDPRSLEQANLVCSHLASQVHPESEWIFNSQDRGFFSSLRLGVESPMNAQISVRHRLDKGMPVSSANRRFQAYRRVDQTLEAERLEASAAAAAAGAAAAAAESDVLGSGSCSSRRAAAATASTGGGRLGYASAAIDGTGASGGLPTASQAGPPASGLLAPKEALTEILGVPLPFRRPPGDGTREKRRTAAEVIKARAAAVAERAKSESKAQVVACLLTQSRPQRETAADVKTAFKLVEAAPAPKELATLPARAGAGSAQGFLSEAMRKRHASPGYVTADPPERPKAFAAAGSAAGVGAGCAAGGAGRAGAPMLPRLSMEQGAPSSAGGGGATPRARRGDGDATGGPLRRGLRRRSDEAEAPFFGVGDDPRCAAGAGRQARRDSDNIALRRGSTLTPKAAPLRRNSFHIDGEPVAGSPTAAADGDHMVAAAFA